MTKLYVANCSQQVQQVNYRLVEQPGVKTQVIEIGSQVAIGGDLLPIQIDGIITQMSPYGLLGVQDLNGVDRYVPLVYSTGAPVKSTTMGKVIEHNRGVLVGEGRRIREESAVAVNQALGQDGGAAPSTLEMSVQEEKRGSDADSSTDPLSEGVRVSTSKDPSPRSPKKSRR